MCFFTISLSKLGESPECLGVLESRSSVVETSVCMKAKDGDSFLEEPFGFGLLSQIPEEKTANSMLVL